MNKIYSINHIKLVEKIILKKREEILDIINNNLKKYQIESALDIGTTEDKTNKSSNYIIKNLKNIKKISCLSDQEVSDNFFNKSLKKSITDKFTKNEILNLNSDLVISNATIEHVGSFKNQIEMMSNILKLAKKIFIINTPYRYHPLDFHTKIPFLHWLPKKIHRKILKFIGLDFFSKEENLNLLSESDLKKIMKNFNITDYKILKIKLFYFTSNLILIGKKNFKF